MKLLAKLFPKAAEISALQKRVEDAHAEKSDLQQRYTTLWESYNYLEQTVQKQRTEISDMKAKLREQTDADLLMVSARITIAILKGQKPEKAYIDLQQNLVQQQRAQSAFYETSVGPTSNGYLLNALGLGNVFGRTFP